ncbi:MAG: bis(5'-nucleosyl)-tetraphosphatase (symmetrical) YqeK [Thermoanaerobacteraceae bacterium]
MILYDIGFLKNKLKEFISENRFIHSVGVMNTAVELADLYGADPVKAQVAGLLHDCAKGYSEEQLLDLAQKYDIYLDEILINSPFLLHGPVGAKMLKEYFAIDDQEIARAIAIHTTGDINMSILDKIIFLSDYIEPGRDFEGVKELRELAYKDLDLAVLKALDNTINYVIKKGMLLYDKTVDSRNDILIKLRSGENEKNI